MRTAVEFLVQELFNNGYFHYGIPDELVEQSKQLEKRQIELAFFMGKNDGAFMERYSDYKHITPNEYYNETYKNTEL